MSIVLALLELASLALVLVGFAAAPVLAVATALLVIDASFDFRSPDVFALWFAAAAALLAGGVPAWRLRGYASVSSVVTGRSVATFGLALLLVVGAGLSFSDPVATAIGATSASVIRGGAGVALPVTLVGVTVAALGAGPLRQFAGVLAACDGALLLAVCRGEIPPIWAVSAVMLALSGAGLRFVERLSLRRVGDEPEAPS
ncbi:hypothetical protein AA23498_2575 [Acetobacter nitrogenifigens DSM 23921 = NBRC 105050]|uniref:Uncharacterized protein n=1 Tax=Acetobacter nitrogenifigens DSM 23921 = NBRC 105050 TaxID=1120919 RepID=A0A511X635_9PROT|nr:hypothetical protein [Acetobacter nitrogenifigens]GBQ96206.1 hypothetical protein AA23498_2575 [Acetobacter nitrogenifigens DSM 23921 = NBRC 105050]GEN58408.1 hypothetical protein ANI02nite_02920 [Acetobacter nitrogenifigens DSM 23921 = NBRC 105050]